MLSENKEKVCVRGLWVEDGKGGGAVEIHKAFQ